MEIWKIATFDIFLVRAVFMERFSFSSKAKAFLKFSYFPKSLQEKAYLPSPRISWKAKKDQVNINFPSVF